MKAAVGRTGPSPSLRDAFEIPTVAVLSHRADIDGRFLFATSLH